MIAVQYGVLQGYAKTIICGVSLLFEESLGPNWLKKNVNRMLYVV